MKNNSVLLFEKELEWQIVIDDKFPSLSVKM